MRPLATLAVVAALAVVGCGDDEPSAQELPVRTVTVPTDTAPTTPATTSTTDTTETGPPPASTAPKGTGGVAPAPAVTIPAPAPPAATTPKGTGGVSPGGDEDQEGGAGDEDPTASPGGVAAP